MTATTDRERLVEQLVKLVDIYSPTFAEGPALAHLEELLDEARLPYFRQPMPDDEERYNLIVTVGPEPVGVMWVGHVDTVALYDDEQRDVTVEEGAVWGLGTADMKGACLAAVEALRLLRENHKTLERGVRVALVVGEEEYGDGSEELIKEFTAPSIIIGEPTRLMACSAHYGYFEVALKARGERAHAAVPEVGKNAIHALLGWLQQLLQQVGQQEWAAKCAVTPRRIDGGTPLFAVPETCEANVDVHLGPGLHFEQFEVPLRAALRVASEQHPGCELEFELQYASPGFDASPEDFVARAFEAADLPFEVGAFRSHSDAAMFHAGGMQTVVCGPGALEVAHRPDEHLEIEQLEQAVRLYYEMFRQVAVAPAR